MPWSVELKLAAARQLKKLPRDVQVRLVEAMEELGNNPRPHGYEKLQGNNDLYRIRTGDYRIIYTLNDTILLVLVVKIGHRREVYR